MRDYNRRPFADYFDRLKPGERLGAPLVSCRAGEAVVSLRQAESSDDLWLTQKNGRDESFWRIDSTDRVFVRKGLESTYYVVAGGLLSEVGAAAVAVKSRGGEWVAANSVGDAWVAPVPTALAEEVSVRWMDAAGREVETVVLPPLSSMVRSDGPTGYGRP